MALSTSGGQVLDQLFVLVKTKHDGGLKEVDEQVKDTESSVKSLSKALNALTAVMGAAAAAGLHAFTGWDRALTTLAGKAGLTRQEFDKLYGSMSGSIARETGASKRVVASGFQQAHSLGLTGDNAEAVVRMGAILEAGNQAMLGEVVENAVKLSNQGHGTPEQVVDAIYAAAQAGAGESTDYFGGVGKIQQFAGAFGIDLAEMAGAISVMSQAAYSIPEGATQLKGFLTSINNPTKQTKEAMTSMGLTPESTKALIRDDGLGAFFEYLSKFSQDQVNALVPGNAEAFQFIQAMVKNTETMAANTETIRNSAGSVDEFGKTLQESWGNLIDRTKEMIVQLAEKFGKPIAKMLRPLLVVFGALLSGLIALDETTGGLLMWIPALVTAILALRLAVLASTKAWGLAKGMFGAGGIRGLFGGGGKGAAKGAGGFWRGVASALGISQLAQIVKGTGFFSTLTKLGTLMSRFAGPLGVLVGLLASLGFATFPDEDGRKAHDKELQEALERKRQEFRESVASLKAVWNSIVDSVVADIVAAGELLSRTARSISEFIIGEEATDDLVDSLDAVVGAVGTVFKSIKWLADSVMEALDAIWKAILNPVDTIESIMLSIGSFLAKDAAALLSKIRAAFGGEETDAAEATRKQASGVQYEMIDGVLHADGVPVGGISPNVPAAPGTGSVGGVVLNDNSTTNVQVDAPGATADDAEAIGQAVVNALPFDQESYAPYLIDSQSNGQRVQR